MTSLVTPDRLEAVKGLGLEAAQAQALLDEADALVRKHVGWHIVPSESVTLTRDGSGTAYQGLPSRLVTEVTSVTDDGEALVEGDTFEWSESGYLRRLCGRFTSRLRGVVVVFTHGYGETPADIEAVVCDIVARASASPDGAVRSQIGSASVTFSQSGFNRAAGMALLDDDKARLAPYRVGVL